MTERYTSTLLTTPWATAIADCMTRPQAAPPSGPQFAVVPQVGNTQAGGQFPLGCGVGGKLHDAVNILGNKTRVGDGAVGRLHGHVQLGPAGVPVVDRLLPRQR